MVRKSTIQELLYEKVILALDQELTKFNFTYKKSKKRFCRQENKYSHIIHIDTPSLPLYYDEDRERIFLTFCLSSWIEIPDYDRWHLETFGMSYRLSTRTENLTSRIELSFDDFEKDNFHEPTASQKFKRTVTLSLSENQDKDIIPITELLILLPDLSAEFYKKSDILKVYENRYYPFEHMYLLVYGGYTDLANEQFEKCYQYLLHEIENKLKEAETSARQYLGYLDSFIKNVQKVSNLSFTNPFSRSIKILDSQNDNFRFSEKTHFVEKLRLDISPFKIEAVHLNSGGDILLFAEDQKIIKLNPGGELVFEKEFDKIFRPGPSGVINGTHDFFINNYIITNDNQLVELQLPVKKLKKGELQSLHIRDLALWEQENKYVVNYENSFLIYSRAGELEKAINMEGYQRHIITEKEWIITQKKNTANLILNFNGELIGTYEYANGNNKFEFSSDYTCLVCYGYATKSQFYNLTNGKAKVLWAHPTFIKGYKEKMYNDINHNFGVGIVRFSPDNKYMVAGAWHGKYVAWTLPKLERIELIPQPGMIELLVPDITTRFSGDQSEDIVTKAELVTLDDHTFLKNRGNEISKIIFFENGDIFITELGGGRFVLSWDRDFHNLTYKRIYGRLDFHAQKYLTQKTKTELIIYQPR